MARANGVSYAPETFGIQKPSTKESIGPHGLVVTLEKGAFEHHDGSEVSTLFFRVPDGVDYEVFDNVHAVDGEGTAFRVMAARLSGYPLDEIRQIHPVDFVDCKLAMQSFFTRSLPSLAREEATPGDSPQE